MLKNLFNSGKCLLGFHQGNWEYEKPKSCLQFQVCTHCAKRSTKVEHTWGEWKYRAEKDCQQIRNCKRCEEKEDQTVHVWSKDAYYKKENECSTVNYCDRCRAEMPAGVIHEWGDWFYTHPSRCDQKQKCKRCGTLGGKTRVEHTWEGWQHSPFYNARVIVCQHCGLMPLNFENTTAYTLTMQDVDAALNDFSQANNVERIRSLIHLHSNLFEQSTAPMLKAFTGLIETHMPKSQLKEGYSDAMAMLMVGHVVGSETVLSGLDDISTQSGRGLLKLVHAGAINSFGNRSQAQSNLDPRLIGHWRYSDMIGGGGFSMFTDYNEIFYEDGKFEEYTVSAGMGSSSRTEPVGGQWITRDNVVFIKLENGNTVEIPYRFSGETLIFPLSGEMRYWERVG